MPKHGRGGLPLSRRLKGLRSGDRERPQVVQVASARVARARGSGRCRCTRRSGRIGAGADLGLGGIEINDRALAAAGDRQVVQFVQLHQVPWVHFLLLLGLWNVTLSLPLSGRQAELGYHGPLFFVKGVYGSSKCGVNKCLTNWPDCVYCTRNSMEASFGNW